MLILSIVALFCGPVLYFLVQQRPVLFELLDGFIFVVIGGLALFHLLPEVIEQGGWAAFLFLALGLMGPSTLERFFHRVAHQAHAGTLLLSGLGLAIHAMTDGVALSAHDSQAHELLSLSIVLHRLPIGLTIWWLLRPHFGRTLATSLLVIMAAASVAGFMVGDHWLSWFDNRGLAWFQSLVVGSILHVVLHRPYHEDHQEGTPPAQRHHWLDGIGSLIGLVVFMAIMVPHWLGHEHSAEHLVGHEGHAVSMDVLQTLLNLAIHAAPALVLSYVAVMAAGALWKQGVARPQHRFGYGLWALILPLAQRADHRSVGYAMTWLNAVVTLPALALTWALFGWQWTLLRALAALLVFVLLQWRWQLQPDTEHALLSAPVAWLKRQLCWLIVSFILAALLTQLSIPQWSLWLQLVVVLVLAISIPVPATGVTALAWSLSLVGVHPITVMMLFMVPPLMSHLPIRWSFRKPDAHYLRMQLELVVASLLVGAVLLGVYWLHWPALAVYPLWPINWWQWLAIAVLAATTLAFLLQQGARQFLGELLPLGHSEHGGHHHHHH